jgi:hypothetical protein
MKICRNISAAGRALVLALAGLLAACASTPRTRTDFAVEVKAMPLAVSEVAGAAEVLFVGGYLLESGRPEFGGFSGLVVEDHRRLIAVSDRGFWWEHPIEQSAEGLIALGRTGRMGPLYDFGGTIAPRGSDRHDAEEMARWPGGQLVSYEGEHRIALYRRRLLPQRGIPPVAARRPRKMRLPADLDGDPKLGNGGIEAMTRLRDGRLAIFSEEQRDAGSGVSWVGDPRRGEWQRRTLELFEDYVPTSAATLPDGDVLLLERSYSENRGVRGRVRRLPAAAFSPDAPAGPIAGVEILRIEPPESVDNFEGIEVIPMDDGRVFFLLLSDDNFNDSQRILLLQFELLAP